MSKIQQLIDQYCPHGVEYKKLGEVCVIQRGSSITKNEITEGNIPVIAGGRKPAYFHNVPNRTGQTIVIAGSGAYAGFVSWWEQPIFVSDAFSVKPKNVNYLNSKFCYYFLISKQEQIHKMKSGGGVPHVYPSDIDNFLIPLPPLPVQEEIVRILDTFTELEAELEAEQEARKKQYEYYRNKLLTPVEIHGKWYLNDKEVEWKKLGEVCVSIIAGGDLPKNYIKSQKYPTEEYPYPIYSNGVGVNALYGFSDSYIIDLEAVTISARGTIGYHTIRQPKFTPIVRLITLIPKKQIITTKFLNYILDITEIGHSGGSIPQLTVPDVKKIPIPIPPLSEQERIVEILDKFDALVNDLTAGLPAEIAARRKQYEYYRNRLLTFPAKKISDVAINENQS